jgi:hypothetical protein
MRARTGAATFENPLIKDTFKGISKNKILSVLEKSCVYFSNQENAYKEARNKAKREIEKYIAIKEMEDIDKLYWDYVLTLNSELPNPVFCGDITYEAVKSRLSTINYGE